MGGRCRRCLMALNSIRDFSVGRVLEKHLGSSRVAGAGDEVMAVHWNVSMPTHAQATFPPRQGRSSERGR